MQSGDRMCDVTEVADFLGFHKNHVYKLVTSGQLKGYRINRTIKIRESDVTAFLEEHVAA